MRSASQFRAGDNDVMHLPSTTYARDYNEVKQKGSALVRGAAPASDGSDVARFWPGGGGDFNSVTRNVFAARVPDQWALARLFALQQMAIADSAIMVYDTKYHYRFWRPYTAIRWTGGDGNAATTADPDWTPFLPTPPYPDYTCGFTSASGAYFEVLRRFFGTDAVSYTYTAHAPGVVLPAPMAALPPKDITRSFATLSQAVADTVDARVNAGIHFRSGCRQSALHPDAARPRLSLHGATAARGRRRRTAARRRRPARARRPRWAGRRGRRARAAGNPGASRADARAPPSQPLTGTGASRSLSAAAAGSAARRTARPGRHAPRPAGIRCGSESRH